MTEPTKPQTDADAQTRQKERLADRVYDLYNAADHVSQLAQDAQMAVNSGRIDYAIRSLEKAERSAAMVDFFRREALRALKEVQS